MVFIRGRSLNNKWHNILSTLNGWSTYHNLSSLIIMSLIAASHCFVIPVQMSLLNFEGLLPSWVCTLVGWIFILNGRFFLNYLSWVSFFFSCVNFFSRGLNCFLMDQFFSSPIENFSRGSNFSELVLHMKTYKTINKFSPNFTFQIPYWGEANLKLNLHFKSIEKHTDKP